MATFKQLTSETFILAVGNVLSLSLGLFTSILVTRALGEEARGVFAWIFTLQGIATHVAALVTYQAARQLAAQHPESDWPRVASTFIGLAGVGTLLSVPLLLYGWFDTEVGVSHKGLQLIAFAAVPFVAAAMALSALVHTRGHLLPTLTTLAAQRVVIFGCIMGLLVMGQLNLTAVTWVNLIAPLGSLALSLWILNTPLGWPDVRLWQEIKGFIGATWLAGVALVALPKVAVIMLGSTGQLAATGHYSVACTLFEAALILPMLAGSVLISHFTRINSGPAARRQTTLVMLGAAGLIAAISIALAPWVVPFLFGAPFAAAVAPFQVLMVCLVLAALHQAWFSRLMAAHARLAVVLPPLLGCAVVTALAVYWVPTQGAMGAAWATLAGYGALVVSTYGLKKGF